MVSFFKALHYAIEQELRNLQLVVDVLIGLMIEDHRVRAELNSSWHKT